MIVSVMPKSCTQMCTHFENLFMVVQVERGERPIFQSLIKI